METTSFSTQNPAEAAAAVARMNTILARQAEEYLNLCANSLAFCNEVAESWRSYLSASAAVSEDVLHKLNGSRSMGDLVGAYNEWLRRNSSLFSEEAGKVPQRVSAFNEKVMDTAEGMRKQMQTMAAGPVA